MPPAFESARFRCCRKIYLRLCDSSRGSKMFLLPCEGLHECFAADEREMRNIIHRQRRGEESARPSNEKIAGRSPERFEIDGHERRMWRRRMRIVFRLVGRDAG